MYTIRDSLYTLKNGENGENSNFAFKRTYLRQYIQAKYKLKYQINDNKRV